jgi:hypothetical protein
MVDDPAAFLIVPLAAEPAPDADLVDIALSAVSDKRLRFGSVWIILSAATSDAIRDHLLNQPQLSGSQIMVMRAGPEAAWTGLSDAETEWLVNSL